LLAADPAPPPAPPIAKKVPKITEINSRKLVDNYFWLRDKPNPEVRAYLEAENAYTDAILKPTELFQKKLYDEMLSRVKETDVEVPYKEGGYWYYTRSEAGKQYGIRCRKKGQHGCSRRGCAGRERVGERTGFHVRAGLRGQRRRQPARLYDG